ncbi:hypothetical protein GCM10020358_45550 [Amorphoplanes nipponensis]|uniref:Uncharacterized protein n=1 Tax=Actinoplanes nipponensis TaxID=135950 RepID=A0A919ML50_9ACTN|nr:hypothetical protein [Actinoplanes nipponensis]GIE53569.1 hypothetical protein Ani05nite_71030 [Actinoplanes nipponensis]
MNPAQVNELLDRAAAAVTPAERDPASRLAVLGRRSVRRRRAWRAAGSVAVAAAVAAVTLPLVVPTPDQPAGPVSFAGLTASVPPGWRISRVATVDTCTAEARTLYLADGWDNSAPLTTAPGSPPYRCRSEGRTWMALVRHGPGQYLSPEALVVTDQQLLQVTEETAGSVYTYLPFTEDTAPPAVIIAADEPGRERLLERVTWPAGPPAPPSGGLALPQRITSVVSEYRGPMVSVSDTKTLTKIREKLTALRDPVPADELCTLRKPGRVGIGLNDGITVVLGDATCPQAVSNGGGRVRVPPGLGRELLALIVASDHAAQKD